jgi:hypothetical protein
MVGRWWDSYSKFHWTRRELGSTSQYDIKKFCKQNNISINLYVVSDEVFERKWVNGKSIQPYLTCSQDEKKSDHLNLLLIEEESQTSSSAALE